MQACVKQSGSILHCVAVPEALQLCRRTRRAAAAARCARARRQARARQPAELLRFQVRWGVRAGSRTTCTAARRPAVSRAHRKGWCGQDIAPCTAANLPKQAAQHSSMAAPSELVQFLGTGKVRWLQANISRPLPASRVDAGRPQCAAAAGLAGLLLEQPSAAPGARRGRQVAGMLGICLLARLF